MKYTFLLPAYKGQFLKEMLQSIQNQTYTDFKVLVSDDCSPDDLYTICQPFLKDQRFSYRRNEKNMGEEDLIAHWNLLVELCDTPYLIMASDDDIYEPSFLKEIDKLSQKYPDVDLIHARAFEIDHNGTITKRDAIYEERVSQLVYISQHEYFNHIECEANHVYRTEALKSKGGFVNFPLAWGSDTATHYLMAKNGAANTNDILFSFRMCGINISSITTRNRTIMKKKFQASLLYRYYILNLLKTIDTHDIEEKLLFNTIWGAINKGTKNTICYFSKALSFKEFIRFIWRMKKEKAFYNKYEIYTLIKKWFMYLRNK